MVDATAGHLGKLDEAARPPPRADEPEFPQPGVRPRRRRPGQVEGGREFAFARQADADGDAAIGDRVGDLPGKRLANGEQPWLS